MNDSCHVDELNFHDIFNGSENERTRCYVLPFIVDETTVRVRRMPVGGLGVSLLHRKRHKKTYIFLTIENRMGHIAFWERAGNFRLCFEHLYAGMASHGQRVASHPASRTQAHWTKEGVGRGKAKMQPGETIVNSNWLLLLCLDSLS